MASNEDYFKREEDRKWRENVDDRVKNLTTDMVVSQGRLEDIEEQLKQMDELLEGKPGDKLDNGLKGDFHDVDAKVNRLWSIIFMDATGEKGLFEEWKRLKRRDDWKRDLLRFWAPVVVAVISTLGLLFSNWDRLKWIWPKSKPDKLAAMIENAEHPKAKHRHYVIREKPDVEQSLP